MKMTFNKLDRPSQEGPAADFYPSSQGAGNFFTKKDSKALAKWKGWVKEGGRPKQGDQRSGTDSRE